VTQLFTRNTEYKNQSWQRSGTNPLTLTFGIKSPSYAAVPDVPTALLKHSEQYFQYS